jgi:predicted nuclease of restriction endonuclease-like (RecB) superfamily
MKGSRITWLSPQQNFEAKLLKRLMQFSFQFGHSHSFVPNEQCRDWSRHAS